MENSTDALFMAGSVLLLIIALTVAISSLTNIKTQTQEIMTSRDQVQQTTDETGNYLNYIKNDDKDVRIVGIETIMASLRRLNKEGYALYIATNELISELPDEIKPKIEPNDITKGKNIIMFTLAHYGDRYVNDANIINKIYSALKDKKFKEYIGIYQNETAEGVSEANKETYKIITFVEDEE